MSKACSHCGKSVTSDPGSSSYETDTSHFIESRLTEIMREKSCCFSCAVWFRRIKETPSTIADGNVSVIVNHEAYIVHPFMEGGLKGFVGHSGFIFRFQMNDGTVIRSNNVWTQGNVPEIFWEDIPNNARRITEEEYNQLTKSNYGN